MFDETTVQTEIRGQIERVTFHNEENKYTIAKVRIEGARGPITIVGTLYSVNPGEVLKLRGNWNEHPRYGRQFKVASYETVLPATIKGIERYLGSGMIKGIGPVMAKRLVSCFGEKTLDVIECEAEKLGEVEGIGEKRIEMIRAAWLEQRDVRDIMVFLQGNGVTPAYAAKIYRQYGRDAVRMVNENPYRLAVDIVGIGFLTADRIAQQLGIETEAPLRIEAGLLYVLDQLAGEGHLNFPCTLLVDRCSETLGVAKEKIPEALENLALQKRIALDDQSLTGPFQKAASGQVVYLAPLHTAEKGIADMIQKILIFPKQLHIFNRRNMVEWVEKSLGITFSARQRDAVTAAMDKKIVVITGGPGTGKTTIINGITKIASKMGRKFILAAPTGRAAKRMTEATGHEARTIHRLLEYVPGQTHAEGGFVRNESNPLDADLIVIDEVSMVDAPLMYHLLKATPQGASLVLVGDVDQLPSVGPGSVLRDIIDSRRIETVRLNEIFRQSGMSRIIVNAHRINNGMMPLTDPEGERLKDFIFITIDDPEAVLREIVDLCRNTIPSQFGFHPLKDIQVLAPMHRGVVGVANINGQLQEVLNPSNDEIARGGRLFKTGDKVLQTRNNYEKDIYNGDIGRIIGIDREVQEISVDFDGRVISYEFGELDEIVLAYAISVHKSQGSEYPVVIMPVLTQHYLLLQRNLIYTGITRGKKLVYLIGTGKALSIAVRNDKPRMRYTLLQQRITESIGKG